MFRAFFKVMTGTLSSRSLNSTGDYFIVLSRFTVSTEQLLEYDLNQELFRHNSDDHKAFLELRIPEMLYLFAQRFHQQLVRVFSVYLHS